MLLGSPGVCAANEHLELGTPGACRPFCPSAPISVNPPPASSALSGIQVDVPKPGVEMSLPEKRVVLALVWTCQCVEIVETSACAGAAIQAQMAIAPANSAMASVMRLRSTTRPGIEMRGPPGTA